MDKYVIWYLMGKKGIKTFEEAEVSFAALPESEKEKITKKAIAEKVEIESLYKAGKTD